MRLGQKYPYFGRVQDPPGGSFQKSVQIFGRDGASTFTFAKTTLNRSSKERC